MSVCGGYDFGSSWSVTVVGTPKFRVHYDPESATCVTKGENRGSSASKVGEEERGYPDVWEVGKYFEEDLVWEARNEDALCREGCVFHSQQFTGPTLRRVFAM